METSVQFSEIRAKYKTKHKVIFGYSIHMTQVLLVRDYELITLNSFFPIIWLSMKVGYRDNQDGVIPNFVDNTKREFMQKTPPCLFRENLPSFGVISNTLQCIDDFI